MLCELGFGPITHQYPREEECDYFITPTGLVTQGLQCDEQLLQRGEVESRKSTVIDHTLGRTPSSSKVYITVHILGSSHAHILPIRSTYT
jgi:hypothetical protein